MEEDKSELLEELDKGLLYEMIKYSLPMIPNLLSWWLVEVSDRTIITFFLGIAVNGIYSAVIVRDILERKKHDNIRQINDAVLLRKIMMFLADNIGNNTSSNSIKNTLINEKLIDNRPAVQTVSAYVNALTEAFVFYEIQRFDIKGREYLKTLGKYYIVDIGLRNYLLGNRGGDSGHIPENTLPHLV